MAKKNKGKLVFVALSGGVDSAVAAGLLKREGFRVVGVFMRCWTSSSTLINADSNADLRQIGCGWEKDEEDARQVAAKLAIPFYSWDFTHEYKTRVVDYFLKEYRAGRTPNPDIECNREIKFGLFLEQALKLGADYIATGHHARLRAKIKDQKSKIKNKGKIFQLNKAKDLNKDQSYFLWTLTQEQLKYSLFPIGDYQKSQVRKMAKKWGLPVSDKPDSQGICFMGKVNVRDFLKNILKPKSGKIIDTKGKIIGEHEGLSLYTIGQRRGINIGGGEPCFVVAKDYNKNQLIVAQGKTAPEIFQKSLKAIDLNWISGKSPQFPLKCKAKIRYRQEEEECVIKGDKWDKGDKRDTGDKRDVGDVKVIFKNLQRAVAGGQSVVFYQGKEMVGGGIIQN